MKLYLNYALALSVFGMALTVATPADANSEFTKYCRYEVELGKLPNSPTSNSFKISFFDGNSDGVFLSIFASEQKENSRTPIRQFLINSKIDQTGSFFVSRITFQTNPVTTSFFSENVFVPTLYDETISIAMSGSSLSRNFKSNILITGYLRKDVSIPCKTP